MRRSVVAALILLPFPAGADGQPPARWRLVEEWRNPGAADGSLSFDEVVDIEPLRGGRIAVLDGDSPQLHILDSAGRRVRSIGRMGGGPGEFRSPRGVAVAPNGTIAISDASNGRLTLLTADGDYIRDVQLLRQPLIAFNQPFWDGVFDRSGRLSFSVGLPPTRPDPRAPSTRLGDSSLMTERFTADLSRSDSSALCGSPLPIYRSPWIYQRPMSRGGVSFNQLPFTEQPGYLARDLDGFEWSPLREGAGEIVRRVSGQCDRVLATIVLRGPRTPIPAADRQAALDRVPSEFRGRVPTVYPWFRTLRVDDLNRLWIERDGPEGRRFEVFSAAGQLLAEADAPRELILDAVGRVLIANGRVYGLTENADGERSLVAWKLVR